MSRRTPPGSRHLVHRRRDPLGRALRRASASPSSRTRLEHPLAAHALWAGDRVVRYSRACFLVKADAKTSLSEGRVLLHHRTSGEIAELARGAGGRLAGPVCLDSVTELPYIIIGSLRWPSCGSAGVTCPLFSSVAVVTDAVPITLRVRARETAEGHLKEDRYDGQEGLRSFILAVLEPNAAAPERTGGQCGQLSVYADWVSPALSIGATHADPLGTLSLRRFARLRVRAVLLDVARHVCVARFEVNRVRAMVHAMLVPRSRRLKEAAA